MKKKFIIISRTDQDSYAWSNLCSFRSSLDIDMLGFNRLQVAYVCSNDSTLIYSILPSMVDSFAEELYSASQVNFYYKMANTTIAVDMLLEQLVMAQEGIDNE